MSDRLKLPEHIRWDYDLAELWADGVIHVVGVTLAAVGAIAMVAFSLRADPPHIFIAAIVYAVSLVAALSVSAIYNIWPVTPTTELSASALSRSISVVVTASCGPVCHDVPVPLRR